jgi:N-acetylgalactosamine kinase
LTGNRGARTASDWLALLGDPAGTVREVLRGIYGDDEDVLAEKTAACRLAVEAFAAAYGMDGEAIVVRSTGRVNLLGMHVDHRGGFVNPIAISDLFLVAQPRDDDRVVLTNADPARYPDDAFSIVDELPAVRIEDWDAWTQARVQERKRAGRGGAWSDYVKAAVLYLQYLHTAADGPFDPPLRGMNILVHGLIPPAAGLSSSSGLVVAAAEACVQINRLPVSDQEIVDLCGLAEWYIGTRGGSGDHAAIVLGRRGRVTHIGSHPFSVDWMPFPADFVIVVANSCRKAEKSAAVRDAFNQLVASYGIGFMLIRRRFPELAPRLGHLRDVNPANLATDEAGIYRILKSLPERATRDEIREMLPDDAAGLERTFGSHAEPADGYAIRSVCLFGISECARSALAPALLARGDVAAFGRMMTISHNGDRVTMAGPDGGRMPYDNAVPDAMLGALIADVESGDPERAERARLWRQPGGYGASIEELDVLVDMALDRDGVVGARLIGAGLGGSIVAVVEKAQAAALIERFTCDYYVPRGLEPAARVVRPIGGAGVLLPE